MTLESAFKTINNIDSSILSSKQKKNLKTLFFEAGYRRLICLKEDLPMPENFSFTLKDVHFEQSQILERLGILTIDPSGTIHLPEDLSDWPASQETVISFPSSLFELDQYQLMQILANGKSIGEVAKEGNDPSFKTRKF